ncbi:hypothetical protein IDM40_05180 [Nocardiopsis sp. HNM0947]|uniref:Uncharacterized protein n=1 Tax=Nocardiopsis coralli TaxID=2772213 RepID=A0ABR9P2L7_9ACTN|nr:hypothetical protein [Nocardiopsis coralli]MBE2998101.1 hypothetical protein [Nocardiopsis coralli]
MTTELTRQINASTDADTPIEVTGSSIEYRPDGTPVIAHTDAQQSGTHLVDCHDAACTESTSRVLTGSPYAWTTTHAPPGLAIDSQGVPHVATADLDAWKLVLVSCLDLTCSEHTTVPLSGFGEQPRTILLGLDGQDRPRLVWGPSPGEEGLWHTGRGPDGEYLWCTEPRCGAPGSDQGSAP